ncbi:MAG: LLM class flavin-dependent oxidoreductase [Alphaproteobacteria bacterium]|nr:LLM class flavin-dependent oxidoreductase [Alphaproteobacteria bacterium]
MKLGFFIMPLHPPERDYTATLKEDREAILLADRLGYAEAFVGEHITDRAETVTSCLMFLASLAHETKRIKLGSGTINIPNSHPATIAAQVAMIDHMLEGRFLMGISPGGLLSDAEVFGNLDADRTAMFVEGIDMVLKIWSSAPPYDLEGKFWKVSTRRTMMLDIGQGIIMPPYQRPHPPIIVTAVAPFSKGVVAAAERGWTPISANFLQPPWVASHWPMYEQGCAKAGRQPRRADWRVAKSICVLDDDKTARRYATECNSPYRFYYKQLMTKLIGNGRPELFKADRAMPDSAVTLDYVMESLVIHGSVNRVVDQLLAFRERVGDFGTLLYAGHDWVDPQLGRRSMELMANEVIPRLNEAVGAAAAE